MDMVEELPEYKEILQIMEDNAFEYGTLDSEPIHHLNQVVKKALTLGDVAWDVYKKPGGWEMFSLESAGAKKLAGVLQVKAKKLYRAVALERLKSVIESDDRKSLPTK